MFVNGGTVSVHQVAGTQKRGSDERPRVKPVEESIHATPVSAPDVDKRGGDKIEPRGVKIVSDVAVVVAHKGGDTDTSPVKRDTLSDDFDFHPHQRPLGPDNHGDEKHATDTVADAVIANGGAVPDALIVSTAEEAAAAAAEVEMDPSVKLKRSCSNIETKRPGPRHAGPDMPARSRSYGDLKDLPGGVSMYTIPRGMTEASPASVKTSRTADRVMLKRRSSSQVLPSRSRKLWWRLFLWSHRNLHRQWSARPSDAGTPGRRGGGYTSDTLEEPDRKNKRLMVDESPPPPVPNQWVAFCAENSLSDRVGAWVSSIDTECLRIAEEEDDDGDENMEHGDCVAGPRVIVAGEPSGKDHGGGKSKRCAAANEVAQANGIVQSLNAFSSVAHISGMGLKVVPMIAPFSSLRAVNLSSNFIGKHWQPIKSGIVSCYRGSTFSTIYYCWQSSAELGLFMQFMFPPDRCQRDCTP